ncbi:MAG: polysaccharide deacetylase family protein [Gammaproteobacteria bacterium]|nr:polysaccharide deacetylase family protein [Gammaproteobacteria bacterium]
MRRIFSLLFTLTLFSCVAASAATPTYIPIFVYHNFEPVKKGSMTISTPRFEEQLQWLKTNGFTVIPLKEAVGYLQGKIASVPEKSVVVTIDDGRITVYQYALPIVKKYNIPVTLFIYPSIISHQPYAMTWEQLKTLQQTGLFNIQDHTYSHPNFKQEKKHRSAASYQNFIDKELTGSKKTLEAKSGAPVNLLAWPFGIYNDEVEKAAAKDGFTMAFSIAYRCAAKSDRAMAVPRYMILQSQNMNLFKLMAQCRMQPKKYNK